MNKQAKNKLTGGVIYALFTIISLVMLCIALYAAVTFFARRAEPDPVPNSELESGQSPVAEQTPSKSDPVTEPVPDQTTTASQPSSAQNLDIDDVKEAEDVADSEAQQADVPSDSMDKPVSGLPSVFTAPADGYVIKGYDLEQPVYSLTMNDYRVHAAADITSSIGGAVFACADGTIRDIYEDAFMGWCVTVDHGGGLETHYMNLTGNFPQGVEEGAAVECGQVIGAVGESAIIEIADTPHLHFEMKLDGISVNPAEFIRFRKTSPDYGG